MRFSDVVAAHVAPLTPNTLMNDTKAIIKESLGCDMQEVFASFDEVPVASGSVAQVYHAQLLPSAALPDGSCDVAVKVRHPGVVDESFIDINIIYGFSDACCAMGMTTFIIPFQQHEFLASLQRQIDLEVEAVALKRFAHNFHKEIDEGSLQLPHVCNSLAKQAILVESWAPGRPISDIFSSVGGTGHGWA